ncbi:hypothetical protein M0657_009845 [Pyricularia oryzae]|nr:hypothetical protein M0657_009845 [Pyricularia oryzae]
MRVPRLGEGNVCVYNCQILNVSDPILVTSLSESGNFKAVVVDQGNKLVVFEASGGSVSQAIENLHENTAKSVHGIMSSYTKPKSTDRWAPVYMPAQHHNSNHPGTIASRDGPRGILLRGWGALDSHPPSMAVSCQSCHMSMFGSKLSGMENSILCFRPASHPSRPSATLLSTTLRKVPSVSAPITWVLFPTTSLVFLGGEKGLQGMPLFDVCLQAA